MLLWLTIKEKSKAEPRKTKRHILDHIVCKRWRSDSPMERRWVICCYLQRCRHCCKIWGTPEMFCSFLHQIFFTFLLRKKKREKHSDLAGVLLELGLDLAQKPSSSCWVSKWWSWGEAKPLFRGSVVGCNLLFLRPPGLNCFPTVLTTRKPRAGISRRVEDKLA